MIGLAWRDSCGWEKLEPCFRFGNIYLHRFADILPRRADIGKLSFFLFILLSRMDEEWVDDSFLALILLLRKGADRQKAVFL